MFSLWGKGPPTTSELGKVETEWIRALQQQCNSHVIDFLSSNHNTKRVYGPPIIRQLNLFLDEKGLIPAKGRFDLDFSLILLPQHSRFTDFTDLLVSDYHQRLHHIGVWRYYRRITSTVLDSIRSLRRSSSTA